MLSDMLCAGAFQKTHKTVGGIAAITARTAQLDVDVRFATNAATITSTVQTAVNASFLSRTCIMKEA